MDHLWVYSESIDFVTPKEVNMPMPVMPWQHLLPFSDSTADETYPAAPAPEADNSPIMSIRDPAERADAIARALAAGVKGADPKLLAKTVLQGIRGEDI